MVDWYKTMARMHRDGDAAVQLGEIGIGRTFVTVLGVLLILIAGNHLIRLGVGSISWLGIAEINVRAAPDRVHTPVSTNLLSDRFQLSFPMLALKGQEIVVRYNLSSRHGDRVAPHARVMVSCFCAASNWHHVTIEHPRTGELILPVRGFGFYDVNIRQSAGPDGEGSVGNYSWGIRSGGVVPHPRAQVS